MSNDGLAGFLIMLTLAASFGIVGGRSLDTVIKAVALQAVLLAGFTLHKGWSTGMPEVYLAAVMTLVVKAGLMPFILAKAASRVGGGRGIKSYVNVKMSFVFCAALVILAYSVTGKMIGGAGAVDRALPAAVAMMLIGLFIMMTRKRAITQVVGLLVIENGVFLAGVGATNGMPPVIELGIMSDALVGVLVMGILVFRINRAFDTIDTENLRNLRG